MMKVLLVALLALMGGQAKADEVVGYYLCENQNSEKTIVYFERYILNYERGIESVGFSIDEIAPWYYLQNAKFKVKRKSKGVELVFVESHVRRPTRVELSFSQDLERARGRIKLGTGATVKISCLYQDRPLQP